MGKIKQLVNTLKEAMWESHINKDYAYYLNTLRDFGISIGDNVLFAHPSSNNIDLTMPFLISIGNNVNISKGFTIFTHDYSAFIARGITGEVLGSSNKVEIGSNIQIGANVTILMGAKICDNVIVAAGAVVNGTLESGYVYGGVPAKRICTINDFFDKRRNEQIEMAATIVKEYYKKYKRIPPKEVFERTHLFIIFTPIEDWPKDFWSGFGQKNNASLIKNFYENKRPAFASYDEFIKTIDLSKE